MGNDEKDIKPNAPAQQAGGDNNADRHGGGGNQRNNWHRWQQGRHGGTPFKGKTKEIAEDIFDNTGQHDTATFDKSLKNIANHLQLELSNDVSEAVCNMTDTKITIPAAPTPKPDPKDPTVMIPPSNIDIFQWKHKFTKASDRLDKYKECWRKTLGQIPRPMYSKPQE